MKTRTGLLLIGAGAILAFAVTTNTSVFNLHTAGWVIMVVGLLWLAVPRRGWEWVGRRLLIVRRPGRRVEETGYPAYARNPATTRPRAGLPAPGGQPGPGYGGHPGRPPGGPAGEAEVVEDVYEE
jgi:hypothetical protein